MKTFPFLCLLLFGIMTTQVFAVDFTVNLITDQHDANTADGICDIDLAIGGEQCTLRAAVEQANNLASNDRILFNLPANSTITLTAANNGEIFILNSGTLEIVGTGANNLTIDGGAGTNRIFYTNNITVTISGITLTGGNGTGAVASSNGGAIFADGGSLTLAGVNITGNSAGGSGGVAFQGGTHRIINSTLSTNTSSSISGGFGNLGGTLTVINSTISGNISSGEAGGLSNLGDLTLRNVTVTNNSAARSGGGIYQASGTLNFGNTIIAGNTAPIGSFPEIQNRNNGITSSGGNLVGDSPGDSGNTGFPITYQSSDIRDTNPMLGPLLNNGGTTPTHALLAGSPAIDTGLNGNAVDPSNGNTTLAFDQRGTPFARIVDGDGNGTAIVDIGAFEVQMAPTAAPVSVSGRVMTASGRGIGKVRLTLTDSSGNVRIATTSAFGYYRFEDVRAGETYILSAAAKRYAFSQQTRVLNVNQVTDAVDFIADSEISTKVF